MAAAMETEGSLEAENSKDNEPTPDDTCSDLEYEEVPEISDDDSDGEFGLGSLRSVLNDVKSGKLGDNETQKEKGAAYEAGDAAQTSPPDDTETTKRTPPVPDDFVRNFLVRHEMTKTLNCFEGEWYVLSQRTGGAGSTPAALQSQLTEESVPDIYTRNEQLESSLEHVEKRLMQSEMRGEKLKDSWVRMKRERDFHRMHHRRVVQEKNKLILDMKRMKKHYQAFEPAIAALKAKYEAVMKEKMLTRLERDKMATKLQVLEENEKARRAAAVEAEMIPEVKKTSSSKKKRSAMVGADSVFPPHDRANPHAYTRFDPSAVSHFTLKGTFRGHETAVSRVAMHPRKPVIATCSDDKSWKLWSVPKGELIMSGEGHKEWLSCVDFSPRGSHLATTSGDGTVKLWAFAESRCSTTFTDHAQAVWACAFHDLGDFLVSCSMDHTARLWDLNSERCRQTFRGHVDSVNFVCFKPFSNTLCTVSGDKTASLWDMRSGLCTQTFFGHENAINHANFNAFGTEVATCDANGVAKVWDIRQVSEKHSFALCDGGNRSVTTEGANGGAVRHALNEVRFDRSGTVLVLASDDGTVKTCEITNDGIALTAELAGHESGVQSMAFDKKGAMLVTASQDATFRTWSR